MIHRLLDAVHLSTVSPVHPPLTPDARDARQQLVAELSKPQYASARPNGLDRIEKIIQDWINTLFGHIGGGTVSGSSGSAIFIIVLVVLVVAAAVVGFLIFGLPRINRRSGARGALFGVEDERDSVTLRRAAESAAAAGDFVSAIEDGFRAIARGLSERAIVTTFPGTTARAFAREASVAFPGLKTEFATAAEIFDGVRYLDAAGTENDWLTIRSLEAGVRATKPMLDAVPA